jgi:outer membrane protein
MPFMSYTTISFKPSALSVAAGLLAASLSFGASAQNLMSMIEAARAYDASYLSDVAAAQATRATAKQARSGLMPQVALTAQATRSTIHRDAPLSDIASQAQQTGLVATQSLFSASNIAKFGKAKQGEMAADIQERAAEQSLMVRVAQAYFDVLTAQDEYASVRASKKAAEQQLEAAKRNFEVGNTTITDTREAQAQFDSIVAQEIASDNNLRVKELALAQVTGLQAPTPSPVIDASLPAMPADDMATWVNSAQDNSAAIALARIRLTNAGYDITAAKGGHMPTLSLEAGYFKNRSSTRSATSPGSYNPTSQIALKFNMPLFAGFAVSNGIDAAVATESQERANLDKAQRDTVNQVKTAYLGLSSGIGQVNALQAALASSQSALQANELGYEVGVRINIDVLNAQTNVFKTQAALAKARYSVLVGGLQLRQAAGTLSIDDVAELNKLITP